MAGGNVNEDGSAEKTGFFFKDDLPAGAKFYIVAVILNGFSVFFYCLYRSFAQADLRWLYLAGLTVLASCFPVKIPLLKGKAQSLTITVSDVFVFAAILFLGPAVAVTLAVVDGLTSSLRVGVKRLYKQMFNLAQLALVAFVVGQIFSQLEKPMPLQSVQLMGLTGLLVEMAFCGLLYFFLNSSAVALAMALVTHQQFSELWTRNFLWALPANSVHAFTAGTVFLLFRPITFSVVIAILPLLGVLYYARKIKFYRIEQIGHV